MSTDKPKAKIIFNGKEIVDDIGKPLLQAAIDAGIEVPHFCYHPGIGVDGNCRLCIVQVEGMPKLQTSCTIPIKEGMVVSSVSEPVKKARKGVLEFFLLNHPLDCPICDKGGECPLQNYSLDAGQSESRMELPKIQKQKHQVIGEHIILDKERCVLCDRCVRFLRNFTGREELQIRNRGSDSEIFIPEGNQLTSGYTGNLADICPVGSLTTREFRFKARPWEMQTSDSVCGECSMNCSAQIWRKDKQILRMTPRVEPQVNEWWLCDKGRFSVHSQLLQDRLTQPHRAGNGNDSNTVEQVVQALTDSMKKVPHGDMAFIADATLTNEEFYQLKTLAKAVGNGKVFIPIAKEVHDLRNMLRTTGLSEGFPTNLENSQNVYILGETLEQEHPVLVLRLRRLYYTQGLKIITVGNSKMGFDDIRSQHFDVPNEPEKINSFFKSQNIQDNSHVLLSDDWVQSKTISTIQSWMETQASKTPRAISVSLLLQGANVAGMMDQWDESIRSKTALETDIQRGKIQGIFWFGKANSNPVFDEYAKGMRIFAQFVLRTGDSHAKAHWILPLDTFFEKKGTYTNTFGKIQPVRRSCRMIPKGLEPQSIMNMLIVKFGQQPSVEAEYIYEELAKELPSYPKKMNEIQESKKTYNHYERALWR